MTPFTQLLTSVLELARKKREAYRHSDFAPKVLAERGIPVVMKVGVPITPPTSSSLKKLHPASLIIQSSTVDTSSMKPS